jgi:hypothetical protein
MASWRRRKQSKIENIMKKRSGENNQRRINLSSIGVSVSAKVIMKWRGVAIMAK